MRIQFLVLFLLSLFVSLTSTMRAEGAEVEPNWTYVEKRLRREGFTQDFIAEMKRHYEIRHFTQVLELNVLLYLRKSDYHGPQVNNQAVDEVRAFMEKNRLALKVAEKKHSVPASVIASLLWIESRHGQNQGNFHVPSVYLHLLQANRKPVIAYLKSKATKFTDNPTPEQLKEIGERTKKKSQWALEELKAIQKTYRWKWTIARNLRGSFAGAFGMPQFIPSSYVRWARTKNVKSSPDLTTAADAILSVAYYLRDHGWKAKPSSHVEALMAYNNSRDYANAILALADKVSPSKLAQNPVERAPLSTSPDREQEF